MTRWNTARMSLAIAGLAGVVLAAGPQSANAEFKPLAVGTAPAMPESQGNANPAPRAPARTDTGAAPETPSRTSETEPDAIIPEGTDEGTGQSDGFRPLSVGVVPAQKQVRIPQAQPRRQQQRQPQQRQQQPRRQAAAPPPRQAAPGGQRSLGGLGLQPVGAGTSSPLTGPVITAPVAHGPIVRNETVLFQGRSNKLTPQAESQLSALAATLHGNKGLVLELNAYADDPDMDKNSARALAGRRILEIQGYLYRRDIPSTRLIKKPIGYSETQQVSTQGAAPHRVEINVRGR